MTSTKAHATQTHSPLPWRAEIDGRDARLFSPSAPYKTIAVISRMYREDAPTNEANAQLIVRCVNSHSALVSALEDAEFLLRKCGANWKEAASMADSMKRSAADARSALTLARGNGLEGEGT